VSGHVQDLLSAYLDGELSPPERGMVEAHLAACEDCSARLEDFAAVDGALRELPVEAPDGYFDSFAQRLRERLRSRGAAPARRLPVWTWAAAAALLLAVLTPLTLRRAPELAPVPASSASSPSDEVDRQKPLQKESFAQPGRRAAAPAPRARTVPPASQTPRAEDAVATSVPERLAEAPAEPALEMLGAEQERTAAAALEDAPRPAAPAAIPPASARAEEGRARAAEAQARRDDAESASGAEAKRAAADTTYAGAGLRGGSGAPARQQEPSASFAALRARSQPGATDGADALRVLRDDWRAFAARNPSGPRGDRARLQVIETGYRAWRASGDEADRAVLRSDARTYLERGDGAHDERVRALLAEAAGP
jgi:anti-sigma factor RsiW